MKKHIQSKGGANKLCDHHNTRFSKIFFELYPYHKKTCFEFIENINDLSYCQACVIVAVSCRLQGILR